MSSRRNLLIRAIGTLAGDIAAGVAVASACAWLIQSAALGLFLSFVLWLTTIVLSLALSQYLVHPVAKILFSDQKLDNTVAVVTSLARGLNQLCEDYSSPRWDFLRSRFARYATNAAPM